MVEMESFYVVKVLYLLKKLGERGWGVCVSKKGICVCDKFVNLVLSVKYN